MSDQRVVDSVYVHAGKVAVLRDHGGGLGPMMQWRESMRLALERAESSLTSADVPVGAAVVDQSGQVRGLGHNCREASADPTAHAEVMALRAAALDRGTWRLDGSTLVTTLEPCLMCCAAALAARVERIVFGTWDPKAGAAGSVWDLPRDRRSPHRCEVIGGVLEAEAKALLDGFFKELRSG